MTDDTSLGGRIVAAFSLTHTPGLGDRVSECPTDQWARLEAGFDVMQQEMTQASPEIAIGFVNDHFDMYWMNNMPTFSVGVSETHLGPTPDAEAWLQMSQREHPGHEDYAREILVHGIEREFDLTRSGPCEFNHNVLIPKRYIWPDRELPVVPIMINCFSPPLPSWRRCYELGLMVREVIASRPERVALFASGGISHWPPFVKEDAPKDDALLQRQLAVQRHGPTARAADPTLRNDFHAREAEMAGTERVLINEQWDREIIAACENGDVDYFLNSTYASVERDGGNGGHEVAMWVALMGALAGAPARMLAYEAVKPWMGGVGLLTYSRILCGAKTEAQLASMTAE